MSLFQNYAPDWGLWKLFQIPPAWPSPLTYRLTHLSASSPPLLEGPVGISNPTWPAKLLTSPQNLLLAVFPTSVNGNSTSGHPWLLLISNPTENPSTSSVGSTLLQSHPCSLPPPPPWSSHHHPLPGFVHQPPNGSPGFLSWFPTQSVLCTAARVTFLKCKSNYILCSKPSNGSQLTQSESPWGPHDLPQPSGCLSGLIYSYPPPYSRSPSYSHHLTAPGINPAHSYLWAFALADPSSWNSFLQTSLMTHSLTSLGLCSNITSPQSCSLSSTHKMAKAPISAWASLSLSALILKKTSVYTFVWVPLISPSSMKAVTQSVCPLLCPLCAWCTGDSQRRLE